MTDTLATFVTRSARLVDGLLRGARGVAPSRPEPARVPLRDAVLAALPLAAVYGLCMGLAAGPGMAALVALKIPLVLFLGVLICFPSFYVFAALTGAAIEAATAARALGAFALVTGAVWAALAPVTGFFTLSTGTRGGFVAGLHVVALGLGILVGLLFLGRELMGMTGPRVSPGDPAAEPEDGEPTTPVRPRPRAVSPGFFLLWLIAFAFVVSQLFADFAPYLEPGPFVQAEPRFFLEGRFLGPTR